MNPGFSKSYYKIGEVAEIIGVPQSTLRYWETEFPELRPRRSSHNRRTYTEKDIELLEIIKFLLHVKGMKIESVKEQLKHNRRNISRRLKIIEQLKEVNEDLGMLLQSLNLRSQKLGLDDSEFHL